jgi:two-component system, OmpR family, sensor histidine kinase ChvG
LNEYTGYLRTLAGKLQHEIRTPLTIVRSSLENLETEPLSPTAKTYLVRAREGTERLNSMLVAMGAATRVEESISQSERTRFDVAPLLLSTIEAYRQAFGERQFAYEGSSTGLTIDGNPDLIVQMLDKLVDNAVDFSRAGDIIRVAASASDGYVRIDVANPGPPLPDGATEQLFESLWQSRNGADSRPHLGLGLYIVKLIAEFHGGRVNAASTDAPLGACFSVWLTQGSD